LGSQSAGETLAQQLIMERQGYTLQRGPRTMHVSREGRICYRVPVSVVQVHGLNRFGWWGWDPLNERWVSAMWGEPFIYGVSLRESLEWIQWRRSRGNNECLDWLKLYGHGDRYGILTQPQRHKLAEILHRRMLKRSEGAGL